jgi:hypothetical protein
VVFERTASVRFLVARKRIDIQSEFPFRRLRMIFHKLTDIASDPIRLGAEEIEAGRTKAHPKVQKATFNAAAGIWAGCLIGLFVVASIVAHQLQFAEGQTVFLQLTVALSSACAGTFLGEHLALAKLK